LSPFFDFAFEGLVGGGGEEGGREGELDELDVAVEGEVL